MKKDRIKQKELQDLYWYLDNALNTIPDNLIEKFKKLEKKYKYNLSYDDNYDCYQNLQIDDSEEYHGIFRDGYEIHIDPKRFYKIFNLKIDEKYEIMKKRSTHLFIPKRHAKTEYASFKFRNTLIKIKSDWLIYKKFYQDALGTIKKENYVSPIDSFNFQCGISDYEGASGWAMFENYKIDSKYSNTIREIKASLYCQFWSQICSLIESTCVNVYFEHRPKIKFERKNLYLNSLKDKDITQLESYKYHDRLYRVWNFLKHNNLSTYEKLKELYPECLMNEEYQNGELSIHYLKITDELIEETIKGLMYFFDDWCEINLDEKKGEFEWNYELWFYSYYMNKLENIFNPLGLTPFD